MRHLINIYAGQRGYVQLVGDIYDGFRECDLDVPSPQVIPEYLQASNRVQNALDSGLLAWSMSIVSGDNGLVVCYGAAPGVSDSSGRNGVRFTHGMLIGESVALHAIVGVLLKNIATNRIGDHVRILGSIAKGDQEFVTYVTDTVEYFEYSLQSLGAKRSRVQESTIPIEAIAHDCAGGAFIAWTAFGASKENCAGNWSVYDCIINRNKVITRTDGKVSGVLISAQELMAKGINQLLSSRSIVAMDAKAIIVDKCSFDDEPVGSKSKKSKLVSSADGSVLTNREAPNTLPYQVDDADYRRALMENIQDNRVTREKGGMLRRIWRVLG